MEVDSQSGAGSTFHIYLPLPSLSDQRASFPMQEQPVLLVISTSDLLIEEIVEFSQRQGLEIHRLRADDDLESILAHVQPAAIAWDLVGASPSDWVTVRRLRSHPRWSQLPFILYGQGQADEPRPNMGLTSFVAKPTSEQTLIDVISASCPTRSTGPILIVDDDPSVRALHQNIVAQGLPGYPICMAEDGKAALTMMAEEVPSLVLLDLMMPGLEGTDVLERMRADPRLRQVPVVILSNKVLSLDDVKQLERHANVTLQSKGILSEDEFLVALNRALFGNDALPPHTSALVKRAIAYIQQNHARPLARWEIAEAVGVSEDYLSRVFSRELGLTPWDYLNRYRVTRAKELLHSPENTVGSVAQKVGFKDQTYFSRVFRKVTGLSPQAYRETLE
jgi:AraC-like DNA-binding protein/DNA-binding response OmpR family regulator